MSNDVERLREALRLKALENVRSGERAYPVLSVNDVMDVLGQEGVTLPTPPRATPLEAAAREVCLRDGFAWETLTGFVRAERLARARHTITAAVGALSEEDVRAVGRAYAYPDCDDGVVEARGVLLVRLTEGGAT